MTRPQTSCALCDRIWPLLIAAGLIAAAASLPACSKRSEARPKAAAPINPSASAAAVATHGPTTAPSALDPVSRGKYLVTIGGCNDCHTPWKMGPTGPEPDWSRMLSGHPSNMPMNAPTVTADAKSPWIWAGAATNTAFHGPWGTSYAFNLTPDEDSGTGIWTEQMFIQTIRSGRHMTSGRPIMPPMPWFNYAKMEDQDLKAIYAYLRTVPPVRNRVPEYQPPAKANGVAHAAPEKPTADAAE